MQMRRERMGRRLKKKKKKTGELPQELQPLVEVGEGLLVWAGSRKWHLRGFRAATLKPCAALM